MTAWTENFVSNFCFFWKNDTSPYGKCFKILFRKFSPLHRFTLLYSNVVKFVRRGIGEIVRYLPDKKFRLPLKLSLLRARPNLPEPAPNIWLTLFQISSKSVHFWRSYSRTRKDRFCPIEYLHDRLFQRIINSTKFSQLYLFTLPILYQRND